MNNLTDRQVELIEKLIIAFCAKAIYGGGTDIKECTEIWFNNREFLIKKVDYHPICEIIDYIKGVKK